ncbi:MAG: sulfotransferase domain-containing protein [Solirubrobacteraceae bacterium]
MSKIGFLIIGAQKGGTTSLFEYMRRHPRIHMPPEKEIEFFNRDHVFQRGWDWYFAKVTRGAGLDVVCGEASTYYMSGRPGDVLGHELGEGSRVGSNEAELLGSLEEVIPRRIMQSLPEAKLICVLRDPVERACSAHRMMTLAQTESLSFDVAVDRLLAPEALDKARAVPTMTNGYIVMGEYARILDGFLRVFPRQQLKVIFTNELADRPLEVLESVFDFVGVADDFVPDNLDSRYREGAVKERIPGLHLVRWQADLARKSSARKLWHALPKRVRFAIDRASYHAAIWNAKRGAVDDDGMSQSVRDRLRVHFKSDGEALEDLLGREAPWLANWTGTSTTGSSSTAP